MSLCDRCPGGQECPFDFMGRACKEYRASEAPGVLLTRADWVRSTSDEELAEALMLLGSSIRNKIVEGLQKKGIVEDACVVDVPLMRKAAYLELLREPVEEV